MQLASHGAARAATRAAAQLNPSRGIHISSFIRVPNRAPAPGTAQKILKQSKNILGRFVAHLTTPGTLRSTTTPSAARSLHHGAVHGQAAIKRGLSLPARIALSRPLGAPHLPKAPAAVPRFATQVGLGTARNFSSARPIFQNLVDNVPIAGRAFLEADWEMKMREERERMRKPLKKSSAKENSGKEMMKPKVKKVDIVLETLPELRNTYEAEMAHYFPTTAASQVRTYLLIPLAPTPTSRLPLQARPSSSSNPSLYPLQSISNIHTSHRDHSARVSDLFERLDTANVWNRGVKCSAYSQGEGICTVLKVEFEGWSEAEVRGVIGESGSGWCAIEEIRLGQGDVSEMSSMHSGMSDAETDNTASVSDMFEEMDPAQSFVLPTLDFSSSFISTSRSTSSPSPSLSRSTSASLSNINASDYYFDHDSDSDGWSDPGSCFSGSSGSLVDVSNASRGPGFGFSSDFASRVGGEEYEPKESMF